MHKSAGFLLALACFLSQGVVSGQEGRIFRNTPETRAIWEFNSFEEPVGSAPADGVVISDLSGNGNDAVVKNNNRSSIQVGEGTTLCEGDTAIYRGPGWDGAAHVATNGDGAAFEFGEDESFSIELYVVRDETPGTQNWGILAGTWHSRTLLTDTDDPNSGAWYGYGYIRNNDSAGWAFVASPIEADGSFTPGNNELKSDFFDIPAGEHYLVTSINRENGIGRVYLDGEQVAQLTIPPGKAFYTPAGYDPAHFAFLTGVDDLSRGSYRTSPSGYSISAARVQARHMTSQEVLDNNFMIQDCEPIPFVKEVEIQAVITSSAREAIVDQCVSVSGANSVGGNEAEIISYQWRIGGGPYIEGDVNYDLSFDEPGGADGVEVGLRITDADGNTAEAAVSINVGVQVPVADISAMVNGETTEGETVWLALGGVLGLSGAGSTTPVSAVAFLCPAAAGDPVPPEAIGEYLWDVDSDGVVDQVGINIELPPIEEVGDFTVTLTVVNEAGTESTVTQAFSVVDVPAWAAPSPPGRIFMETDDAIAIWEFNSEDLLVEDPLRRETIFEDFSGNGLDVTVEANGDSSLVIGEGAGAFDDNSSVRKGLPGQGRLVVNDDDNQFEFSENQDFSIELYLNREEVLGTAGWGVLAGTWHSRNLVNDNLDPIADGAWYGYGFVRPGGADVGGQMLFNMSPINPDGSFVPSWNEIKTPIFDIPTGRHYVVATVSRSSDPQTASVYLDGEFKGAVNLPPGKAFISPAGHDHARFMFFAGEDDASRGQYRVAPSGYSIDSARISSRALSAEEIAANNRFLKAGYAVPLQEGEPKPPAGVSFVRGDSNGDGEVNISDPTYILVNLFLGGGGPPCVDAADGNDDGGVDITDAIYVLNFLFLGGAAPPAPFPACGADPTVDQITCEPADPACG